MKIKKVFQNKQNCLKKSKQVVRTNHENIRIANKKSVVRNGKKNILKIKHLS